MEVSRQEVDNLAKTLWDYLHLNQTVSKADCILVLGNYDKRVAQTGADLYLEGFAPLMICSGKSGRLGNADWTEPEAQVFAEIAVEMGVPKESILIENKSTNLGENIELTRKMLNQHKLEIKKLIVVTLPYSERRVFATFRKYWPEVNVFVTSPPYQYENCAFGPIDSKGCISILTGEISRITAYPGLGFSIPQIVPKEVNEAYEKLVRLGFIDHLVK